MIPVCSTLNGVGAKGVEPLRVLGHPSTSKADAFTRFATPRYGLQETPVWARDRESRAAHPAQGQPASQVGRTSRRCGRSFRRRHRSILPIGFRAGTIPSLNTFRRDCARLNKLNKVGDAIAHSARREDNVLRPFSSPSPIRKALRLDTQNSRGIARLKQFALIHRPSLQNEKARTNAFARIRAQVL